MHTLPPGPTFVMTVFATVSPVATLRFDAFGGAMPQG